MFLGGDLLGISCYIVINYYICPQYKTQERCAFLTESAGVSCQYADYEKVSTECRL